MRTVSIRLEDLAKMAIKIGFVGENEHTRVCIDCKKAFEEYPNAAAALTVQPPAGEAYPDVTTRDGDTVIWDVEDHDLTDEGEGEFQLSFVVDETVMKSYIGRTAICRSIVPAGDVPAAIDDWLTRANAALAEIPVEIAAALEEAKESGEFDGRGISDAVLNDDYTLTLYFTDDTSYTTPSIKGGQGEPGFSPTITVTEITGGHRLTITDVEGTQTVDILDGEKGDTGNGIAYCVLNQDYTLTITYTDGRRYTTQSIRGAQGEQGEPGATGETGATPVISIGTVSTLTPGSDATASMDTTDPEHPVLSLGIPEGEPGEVTEAELQAVADAKADLITESITTPAAVQTITDGGNGFQMGLEIGLEPVQDLHGYGYPWVGGAGKNLYNIAEAANSICNVSGNSATLTATSNFQGSNGVFIPVAVGKSYTLSYTRPTGGRIEYREFASDKTTTTSSTSTTEVTKTITISNADTAYLRIILSNGTSGAGTYVFSNIQLESGSSATSYAPYSNICPITGHTGVEVVRTGKNLMGSDAMKENALANNPTKISWDSTNRYLYWERYTLQDGVILTHPFKENTQYTFIFTMYKNSSVASLARIYYTDGTYNGIPDMSSTGTKCTVVKTSTAGKTVAYIGGMNNYEGTARLYVDESGIFEGVLTAQDFEAYNGNTYAITFPSSAGTVYGGTLKVNKDGTGVLTVNRVTESFDGNSSDSITTSGSLYGMTFRITLGNNAKKYGSSVLTGTKCNMLKEVTGGSTWGTNGTFSRVSNSVLYIYAKITGDLTTKQQILEYLTSNPLQFVYELATPVTYNLTASQVGQIKSLYGTNNVWCEDAEQTINSIDYGADTKLYISKELDASKRLMELIITANREDEMKATKAYSAGDLLIVNGTLYKATTSIANGATLTAGTNVTATTVAAEIAAIS